MSFQLTKDTLIADILQAAPETEGLFYSIGMHCLGCAMANDETLAEACLAHGVDVDQFIEKANSVIADFAH
jgi:hybrid cluster-associated redox disulfide protein